MAAFKFDVLVSYAGEDREDVSELVNVLETKHKLRVQWDRKMAGDGAWSDEFDKSIHVSRCVVLFARRALTYWQDRELHAVHDHREGAPEAPFPRLVIAYLPEADIAAIKKKATLTAGFFAVPFQQVADKQAIKDLVRHITQPGLAPIFDGPLLDEESRPQAYRADAVRIAELLVGARLYSTDFVGLRELVQNAYDACLRRQQKQADSYAPRIVIHIPDHERYFDVEDNGIGMTRGDLLDYFFVIGASSNTEFLDKRELNTIGVFGLGFISCFAMAKTIAVSTTAMSRETHHFQLTGITDAAEYSDTTLCDRAPGEPGTTVRIHLKDELFQAGLRPTALLEDHCRHVPWLHVNRDGETKPYEQGWNRQSGPRSMVTQSKKYKAALSWGPDLKRRVIISSGGIRVCDATTAETGLDDYVFGEINVEPQCIDLNMARNGLVQNEKLSILSEAARAALHRLIDNTHVQFRRFEEAGELDLEVPQINRIINACRRSYEIGRESLTDAHKDALEDIIALGLLATQPSAVKWKHGATRPQKLFFYIGPGGQPSKLDVALLQYLETSSHAVVRIGDQDRSGTQTNLQALRGFCSRRKIGVFGAIKQFPRSLRVPTIEVGAMSPWQKKVFASARNLARRRLKLKSRDVALEAVKEDLGSILARIGDRHYISLGFDKFPVDRTRMKLVRELLRSSWSYDMKQVNGENV